VSITNPYPHSLYVCVFDDMRELPYHMMTDETSHCKTEAEFMAWLDSVPEGQPVVVVLDHDLGGVAFGEDTSRNGIRELVDRHIDERLDIVVAYIVTMNPAGQQWIVSEMERGEIDFDIDVGGRGIGMLAQPGF
jgi:hypothetical protein